MPACCCQVGAGSEAETAPLRLAVLVKYGVLTTTLEQQYIMPQKNQ